MKSLSVSEGNSSMVDCGLNHVGEIDVLLTKCSLASTMNYGEEDRC